MTVLVEVGPNTVRGHRDPPSEWVAVAIDCVDDDLALLDDRLVAVTDLWRDVLKVAIGDQPGQDVAFVLPSWWPDTRAVAVTAALDRQVATHTRLELLTVGTDATVIEVADELVLIAHGADEPAVLDRHALDLIGHLGGVPEVLVDLPAGVTPLPREVLTDLSGAGIRIGYAGHPQLPSGSPERAVRRGPPRRRVAAGLGVVTAVGLGWALQPNPAPTDEDAVWLIESGVGMQVPAHWTVERVTAGPGSARVQVSDPAAPAALHLTQSRLTTPDGPAATLQSALDAEAPGVFVDFRPNGRVGDRAAVTYREVRADSHTRWAVVTDDTTAIAIGCQSAPADAAALQHICTRAVESARVFD